MMEHRMGFTTTSKLLLPAAGNALVHLPGAEDGWFD